MKFLKAIVIGASLLAISACSSTSSKMSEEEGEHNLTKATPLQIEELETKVGDRVFFEFDSPVLTSEAQDTLSKQASFMEQNPQLSFIIEGHADETGTREYNLALSERRANSVMQYLTNAGVPASRLTVVGYGKERPAVLGSNDWAWSQNRRAVSTAQ